VSGRGAAARYQQQQRAARRDDRLSVLARVQLGIEALYRVETHLDIDAFVIDEGERAATGVARAPREQLLVRQSSDEELDLALFVDERALDNLERHDPAVGLHGANFDDFCLIVEGVSHFIYVALCAAVERRVTALELELQAEVDKFACCLLLQQPDGATDDLRQRLFHHVRFADDLDATERDRYRTANGEADRYAESLERRFVDADRLDDMLAELRRFYRLGLTDKLGHIARAAG
jgi:hypothetical protein